MKAILLALLAVAAFDPLPVLRDYLRVDTSNPPGNEAAAARFLQGVLEREGISSEIVETGPGRACLVARLRGDGSKGALILSHHMDVVQADRARWTTDPFGAAIQDGFLYGRGSLDMKTSGITHLAAMIRLKREGATLARDIVLIGTADEEVAASGMQALIARRPDVFAGAELFLTEGDTIDARGGGIRSWNVSVGEKAVLWLRLVAKGPGGHGSAPPAEGTAVDRLIAALERLRRREAPVVVLPEVARAFAALADRYPGLAPAKLRALDTSLQSDADFRKAFLADPERAARVRNTLAITVLRGAPQTNVIPSEAVAELDCRLLPGTDPAAVIADIRKVIDDPTIAVEEIQPVVAASSSRTDSALYHAIESVAARRAPGVPVVPTLLVSWTESALVRPLGIQAYGFEPLALDETEAARSHGDDERVSLENVRSAAEIVYEVVRTTAVR